MPLTITIDLDQQSLEELDARFDAYDQLEKVLRTPCGDPMCLACKYPLNALLCLHWNERVEGVSE